nr:hypothetical protein [Hankyongella ginsenosidimutans]
MLDVLLAVVHGHEGAMRLIQKLVARPSGDFTKLVIHIGQFAFIIADADDAVLVKRCRFEVQITPGLLQFLVRLQPLELRFNVERQHTQDDNLLRAFFRFEGFGVDTGKIPMVWPCESSSGVPM